MSMFGIEIFHCTEFFSDRKFVKFGMVRKYTHIRSFRKYTFKYQGSLILLMSAFSFKKLAIFGKNITFFQNNSVRTVLEIF